MPKRVPPLTQLQIENAKPREKPYKLADGGGLYLEVTPAGGKHWRMKYRQPSGKENKLHLGAFPTVSLADAREKRDSAKQLLAAGADPARAWAEQARQARLQAQNTFEHVARDWHQTMINQWQPQTAGDILRRFEADIFPAFGQVPISEIQARDVLDAIRAVERRGALEIANRLTANCSRVFKYAIRCGLAERNPAEFLREVLAPREKGHFAAIGSDALPEFLRALYANEARMGVPTRVAMRLMLLVFVWTSELIDTPWSEIDLKKGEWIIPWKRMKRGSAASTPTRRPSRMPLAAGPGPVARPAPAYGRRYIPVPELARPAAANEQQHAAEGARAHGLQGRHDRPRLPRVGDEYAQGEAWVPARGG
jgi:integrase